MMVKGYKAFDKDLKCRGMQYEVGKTFEIEGPPHVCNYGLHFCENAADVFNFYNFNCEKTRVCEVIAHGDVSKEEDSDTSKCATNQLEIVRELTWEEFLVLCNTGKSCTGLNNTGYGNTGNRNTGNRNTGNRNTGNRNTGDYNTGYGNTGDYNTGYGNTGDYNTGDYNTGDYNTGYGNTGYGNTGNRNTGYGNACDRSNGVFCTVEPTINFFNKPSEMTLSEFMRSEARYVLDRYLYQTKWIYEGEMSDEEKEKHPEHKTTGGYLVTFTYKEAWQNAWERMNDAEKACVKAMPNFDSAIFEEITGIKVA